MGISKFLVGFEQGSGRGVNMDYQWYHAAYRSYLKDGLPHTMARHWADESLRAGIDDIKGLTATQRAQLFDLVKRGEAFVNLTPKSGPFTALHEVMHSIINKILRDDDPLGKIDPKLITQFKADIHWKATKRLGIFSSDPATEKWLSAKAEFFTEVLTQYHIGNLEPGSRTEALAQALERHHGEPFVRDLIGKSLSIAVVYKMLMNMKKGDKQRSSAGTPD